MGCYINENIGVGIMADTDEKKSIRDKEILLRIDDSLWSEKKYGPYFNTVLLFITNQCNLDCKNCFYGSSLKKKPDEMSVEYIETIINSNPQIDKYDIIGGEPLMHSKFEEIIDLLEKKNKKIGIYTNGFLLHKLKVDYKNVKLNLAFHAIKSDDLSLKPISNIYDRIKKYQYIYPMKLVFLIDDRNKHLLSDFVEYIGDNFVNIKSLTIGAMRNEADYYNNDYSDVINLEEYCKIVQDFLDTYKGRLNIDIFGEGMLYTEQLPKSKENQINRFRCIFKDNKYCDQCPKTKKYRCLTDKIKLQRKVQ